MDRPAGTLSTTLQKATMKTILVLATLAAASMGAQASCSITMVRHDTVSAAFKKHGGWTMDVNKFDTLCEKLRKGRARISVQAASTVLAERSIGWAALSVQDLDSEIGTISYARHNTSTDTYASADKAEQLMVKAINGAAEDWSGVDQALAELDVERKRARRAR